MVYLRIKQIKQFIFQNKASLLLSGILTFPSALLINIIFYSLNSKPYSISHLLKATIILSCGLFWVIWWIVSRNRHHLIMISNRLLSSNKKITAARFFILSIISLLITAGLFSLFEFPQLNFLTKPNFRYLVEIESDKGNPGNICIMEIKNSNGTVSIAQNPGAWKRDVFGCEHFLEAGKNGKIIFENIGPIDDEIEIMARSDPKAGGFILTTEPGTNKVINLRSDEDQNLTFVLNLGNILIKKTTNWGLKVSYVLILLVYFYLIPVSFYKKMEDQIYIFSNVISNALRKKKILIILLFLIIAIIQIGNYSNRMAIAHGDDWPQTYSYFIKYPDRYQNDILTTKGYQQGFATIQNLIPVSLYYFFNIPPDFPTYLLIIAQFVLLALSFRRLSETIFKNSLIGLSSALFIVGAEVYNLNLANYGHVMFSPYAGHLVIPFIIYAFTFMLERKIKLMSISLLIGGLIHPTLTLYAIMIIGLYDIFKNKKLFSSNILFILLALIILTVLPRLAIQKFFGADALLTFEEMQVALNSNQHMTLVNLNSRTKAFLLFLPLIILGLREIHKISEDYLILFISSLVSCIVLIISHYLGWQYKILNIIQLIPHRASLIFTIISVPVVISFLLKKSMKFSILPNVLYVVFIYKIITSRDLAFITSPAYIYFIIAFYIIEILEIFLSKNIYASNLFSNMGSWSKRLFFEIKNEKTINLITTISITVLLFSTLIKSIDIGNISRHEEYSANYEIQEWIKNNIDENALIVNSGRVVSQRASIKPSPQTFYVYTRLRAAKDYDDRIYQFFYDWYEDPTLTAEQIRKIIFDEEATSAFCRQFKCDYILRKNNKPLSFELIHMNSYFSLYKIPEND